MWTFIFISPNLFWRFTFPFSTYGEISNFLLCILHCLELIEVLNFAKVEILLFFLVLFSVLWLQKFVDYIYQTILQTKYDQYVQYVQFSIKTVFKLNLTFDKKKKCLQKKDKHCKTITFNKMPNYKQFNLIPLKSLVNYLF